MQKGKRNRKLRASAEKTNKQNREGCPIHPNRVRWTKAMNNNWTHRKSIRERLSRYNAAK